MPNYSKNPPLTINDEEYTVLIEVCEEFEKQKIDKTTLRENGESNGNSCAQSPYEKKP